MSTLYIKNATIVNEEETFIGSVVVKNGKIEDVFIRTILFNKVRIIQTQSTKKGSSSNQILTFFSFSNKFSFILLAASYYSCFQLIFQFFSFCASWSMECTLYHVIKNN